MSLFVLWTPAAAQTIGTTYVVDDITPTGAFSWGTTSYVGYVAYGADSHYGSNSSRSGYWEFSASPGTYSVYYTVPATAGRCTLLVRDGSTVIHSEVFDQTAGITSTAFTSGGVPFMQLGSDFVVTSTTTIRIEQTGISGYGHRADAIAYIKEADPVEPPGVPVDFEIVEETIGYTEATVEARWQVPSGPTPDSYTVQVRTGPGEFTSGDSSVVVTHPLTMAAFPTMNPGDEWQFRVRSNKDDLHSDWSSTITHTMGHYPPMAASSFDVDMYLDDAFRLTWEDQTSAESNAQEDGWEIWRKTAADDWELVHTTSADAEQYIDEGLEVGQEYEYRIRAVAEDPLRYSAYTVNIVKTLMEGFSPGFPDGPYQSHVSGAVPRVADSVRIADGAMLLALTEPWSDGLYDDPDHGYWGMKTCGTKEFVIEAHVAYASSYSADNPYPSGEVEQGGGGEGQTVQWKIVVGRNGYIQIVHTPDGGFGGLEPNARKALYPSIIKWALKTAKEDRDGSIYPRGDWDAREKARYDAYRGILIADLERLYQSMTVGGVNWAEHIPRCPGENFDSGSGGGGSSEIPGGVGSMPDSEVTDLPEITKPAKDSKQAQLTPREFELSEETNSTLRINADPRWLFGTDVFNTEMKWEIDIKEPFKILGPDVNTQMNDAKLWIRAASLVTVCIIALTAFLNDFWSY